MKKVTPDKIFFVVMVFQLVALGAVPCIGLQHARAADVQRFSLLAETMQPVDSTIGYNSNSAYLTTTTESTINSVSQYIGQLSLPDGATITSVVGFGLDTDPDREFYFRLYRYNLDQEPVWSGVTAFSYSGIAFSDGKIEIPAPVDPDMAVVDNAQYSYGIFLVLPVAVRAQLGVLRFLVEASVPQTGRTVIIPLPE